MTRVFLLATLVTLSLCYDNSLGDTDIHTSVPSKNQFCFLVDDDESDQYLFKFTFDQVATELIVRDHKKSIIFQRSNSPTYTFSNPSHNVAAGTEIYQFTICLKNHS